MVLMTLVKECDHGIRTVDDRLALTYEGRPVFHNSDICLDITTFAHSAEGWQFVYLCLQCSFSIKVPFSRERDKGKKIEVCP